MNFRDGRKLTGIDLHERRKQAVLLHKKGETQEEIGRVLGVHRVTVGAWIRKWREEGAKSLKPKRRGVKSGSGRTLTSEQEKRIRHLVTDRLPDQLKMPFALWTREAVSALILEETGIRMPVRTVGDYLSRWGMTPQKPVKRAYERSEPAVKRWLEQEYPAIKARAKEVGAEIQWMDETGLSSSDNRGRGFAPAGNTPVLKHKGKAEKTNMISSVTNQGKLRFMFYDGRFNQLVLIKYLQRLVKNAAGRHLIVIMDNHPSHHGKILKAWAGENRLLITLEYLPSYAPDLNPDEFLNCDLKSQIAKRPERRKKGEFRKTATGVMRSLQKTPDRIASYFRAKDIAYAA